MVRQTIQKKRIDTTKVYPDGWFCLHCGVKNPKVRTKCRVPSCRKFKDESRETKESFKSNGGTQEPENSCKVCMNEKIDCKLPCRHVCLCMECANTLTKCPFCRKSYTKDQIEQIYLVE